MTTCGRQPGGHQVQDAVERREVGEVLAPVVADLVGTERPRELDLAVDVDAGQVRSGALGERDRERSGPAAGAVDQQPLPGGEPRRALEGDRAGLGQRRRLRERQPVRLVGEDRLRRQCVLSEAPMSRRFSPYTTSPTRKSVTASPTAAM
jgi:hypothetical protein